MSKYIYIKTANDSAYMNTAKNFKGAHHSADTVIDLYFEAAGAVEGAFDKITLTVTTQKEQEVMDSIGGALAGTHSKGMIVIADDVASKYVNANITAVGAFALAQTAATFKVPTESVTANDTLTAAESGTTYVFADAAAVLTLPDSGAGDIIGTTYKFISNFTGTGQEVICADTTNEFFIGTIIGADQDADASPLGWNAQVSDGFSSIEFTGVTDGKIGSYFTVTNYAADRWLIEGVVAQSGGSEATPFAAS
jgi:hypothetical protein